ncbi:MAG: glutathione S- transferase, nitrogen catabolite repression regulator [Lichina confinis]|nr:MAG: glutathione S- transferase, nitrogen catabolite repression regulator [Lichina confinis]
MGLKPVTLYGHVGGPNPWKVVIVLEALNVPYEHKILNSKEVKAPDFEQINPNGRVPALQDPNTGITIWESNAIVEYLVDKYDRDSKLTYHTDVESYQIKQWLYFQASGQGPYFGQGAWFQHFHSERVQSAVDRYVNEIKRVLYVLNKALEGREYLVGEKATIADIVFVPWDNIIPWIAGEDSKINFDDYPNYNAWKQRISALPAVKKANEMRANTKKA